MNTMFLVAGGLAAFVAVGHFAMGIRWYLKPMLKADIEEIPKTTMQAVFHYVSVFISLSALFLIAVGMGYDLGSDPILTVRFIGLNYVLFTITQVFYSFKNGIRNPLVSMFQWTMFLPIGLICLLAN